MKCPKCHGATRVVDSTKHDGGVRRRRECKECGNRFTTREMIVSTSEATVERETLAALAQLQEAATDYCITALVNGMFPKTWPSDVPDDHLPPLVLSAKRLAEAIQVAKTFTRGDVQRESLLEAARATFRLWAKHGMGDDHNESDPIFYALKEALDAWKE